MKTFILYLKGKEENTYIKTKCNSIEDVLKKFYAWNKDKEYEIRQIIDTSFDEALFFKLLFEIDQKI
jgi:hypothetical protein